MHLGGKIEVVSKVPLKTRADLSMAYTPGVARVCEAIHQDPEKAFTLTIKKNTVAVVTDGTAVLGLGDIGPAAAMPVMEGKAMLFKEFGGIDAFPICLDTKDPDEIVRDVKAIAPGFRRHQPGRHFGPALLRDRRAAETTTRHPGLPRRPARHGRGGAGRVDQRAQDRGEARWSDIKLVVDGVGAAGVACTKILMAAGVRTSSAATRPGGIYRRPREMNWVKDWYAQQHQSGRRAWNCARRDQGCRRVPRAVGAGPMTGRSEEHGAGSDCFRDGQPGPEIMPEEAAPTWR